MEYAHSPGGLLLSQRHGPLQVSYGYDLDKNLTALKALSSDEVLADNQYEYDGNGNRTKKRQMEGETQYIYDGLNQLTIIEYPTLTEELFYDKAGNRTRRTAGDEEDLYSYDPRNRLVSHTRDGVTTPLVYDEAGNLLRDGRASYEYDGFNRAVKSESFDGNIQVNRYDAEGLRYELEENGRLVQFIFHQGDVVAEQNETDTLRLIRGYDLIASDAQSARTYYHYASDELGSTTHIVDEKGKVLNRYAYDAFGNITEQEEAVPNRFKFNGQQYDPITQQYYLRARYYNPVVARFTQEDLYRGDGLNLYAYCHNNPVVYADPSGYLCESGQALYRQYRDDGYTAAEAYALTTGRNPLNVAPEGNSLPNPQTRPAVAEFDSRSDLSSMTRDQYEAARRAARGGDNLIYQAEQLTGMSSSRVYNAAHIADVDSLQVLAVFELNGNLYLDVNPKARDTQYKTNDIINLGPTSSGEIPTLSPGGFLRMNNISGAHGEVGAMTQAYTDGMRGGNGNLTVFGREVCGTCRNKNIPTMMSALELDSLYVDERLTGSNFTIRGES